MEVRRERGRADRSGDPLGLAAVRRVSPGCGADSPLHEVHGSILGGVRCMDQVGGLRPGPLGRPLPATSVSGASTRVVGLRGNDTTGSLRPGRHVLDSYPGAWVRTQDEVGPPECCGVDLHLWGLVPQELALPAWQRVGIDRLEQRSLRLDLLIPFPTLPPFASSRGTRWSVQTEWATTTEQEQEQSA